MNLNIAAGPLMVLDRFASLADPSLSGKSLLALKRIAEALQNGFLTPGEANRAAAHIAPACAQIFTVAAHAQGMGVIPAIEMILQKRYPARFRADVSR